MSVVRQTQFKAMQETIKNRLLAGGLALALVTAVGACAGEEGVEMSSTDNSATEMVSPDPNQPVEFIEEAEYLISALDELKELSITELKGIAASGDLEKLAYYKIALLMNAAEDGNLSGDCEATEHGKSNPLYFDIQEMSGQALICAVRIHHIAYSQRAWVTADAPRLLDNDLAEKAYIIHYGVLAQQRGQTLEDMIPTFFEKLEEAAFVQDITYNDVDIENTKIIGRSTVDWGNGHTYDTITVPFAESDGDVWQEEFALVPVRQVVDFYGVSEQEQYFDENPIDYNKFRVDSNGNAITKDTEKPVLIPMLIGRTP